MNIIQSRSMCLFFALFAALRLSAQTQTLGSTFLQHTDVDGVKLTQSIGQPYAVFKQEQTKANVFYQGQLLPLFQNVTLSGTKVALSAFPNPVEDILNLGIATDARDLLFINAIKVIDLNGRVVKQINGTADFAIQKIDVSSLSPGIYVLSVGVSDGNDASIKFSKISSRF